MSKRMQELTREQVDEVFESAENQADYIIGLYQLVYPDWEEIAKVDGFPEVSQTTWEEIAQQAIDFDQEHHPDVMAGGAWMNNGFSSQESMPDWNVKPCEVTYK